jgi:deazaflavin-dependent oxidoreductase (nitroreductase family)
MEPGCFVRTRLEALQPSAQRSVSATERSSMPREPFAARLYFIPMALRGPQNALVAILRRYFERAPGWVLLTTRGRKTGLPREVLLPCERSPESLIIISTYGWRSHWLRNIQHDSEVQVSCAGWIVSGQAEVIECLEAKRSLVRAHPFFPPAPFAILHAVLRTLLRPVLVQLLRIWVAPRPMVIIRPERIAPAPVQEASRDSEPA